MTPPSDDIHRAAISELGEQVLPTGKIVPADNPWMTAPSARLIMDVLNKDGAETRFVGGCVRDAVLKREVNDVDIATTLRPDEVTTRLEQAGLKVIPTGVAHGTVTAVAPERHYQITTLRVDVEADGRHAHVAFTSDWTADAARRDFRFNALSATPEGDVYDPFHGLSDLAHGRVRFVGNALERIDEDYLRILRYFRMFAYYGIPAPNKEAMVACRLRAPKLVELSGERMREELVKTLLCRDPASICLMMAGEHIFKYILPEYGDVGRLRTLQWLEQDAIRYDSVRPDALRRLAALVRTDARGGAAIADRFRFSNVERARFIGVVAPEWQARAGMSEYDLARVLRNSTPDIVRDVVLVEWATQLAIQPRQPAGETEGWQHLIEFIETWRPIEFPLRGQDVLDLGITPGPDVSELLKRVEGWWEESGFVPDRDACLNRLRDEHSGVATIVDEVRDSSTG